MNEFSKRVLLKRLKELNEEVNDMETSLKNVLLKARQLDASIKDKLNYIAEIEQELRESNA